MQLIIAEKPSVARSIAGVIGADQKRDGYMEGNGYLVSWCIGHLVSLADAGAYDERFKKWRYDDLDRKSTRLNSSHNVASRMPSSA